MDPNPYQPPSAAASFVAGPGQEDWNKLRSVAHLHRLLNYCVLAILLAVLPLFFLMFMEERNGGRAAPAVRIGFMLLVVYITIVFLSGVVLTIALAGRLWHPAATVLLGPALVLPGIGFLVACWVGKRAENYIVGRGFPVGLFGADVPEFPPEP